MSRTKAKFSELTKESILDRDNYTCIIKDCDKPGVDPHHAYFNLDSNTTETRNNIDQGVTLCREHHEDCHGCKSGQGIRLETINYLKEIYE